MIKELVHRTFNRLGYRLIKSPSGHEKDVIKKGKALIHRISPRFQVLNGPFKGLEYPSLDITEASLVPKIVGSYEAQLHSAFSKIINTPYTDIIDIGSAEGYYAVGLARKLPRATIHCFDINEKDLDFCRAMAKHNAVDNLTFNNSCDSGTLIDFDFKGRGLIICDCEGCEVNLFTSEVIDRLTNVDVLVELHDNVNPVISAEILTRFQRTHDFQIFNNQNVDFSQFRGLEELSDEDKEFATLEHRGGLYHNIFMEWAFFTCK